MKVKSIIDETFQDYKKPGMLIATCYCDWKCFESCETNLCQNSALVMQPNRTIDNDELVKRYIGNPVSKAMIFGGLEPMHQFGNICLLIAKLRYAGIDDDVVIYTGFNEDELEEEIRCLQKHNNIIVKFGRYVPNQNPRYDEVLGVSLASPNQYAKKIS